MTGEPRPNQPAAASVAVMWAKPHSPPLVRPCTSGVKCMRIDKLPPKLNDVQPRHQPTWGEEAGRRPSEDAQGIGSIGGVGTSGDNRA